MLQYCEMCIEDLAAADAADQERLEEYLLEEKNAPEVEKGASAVTVS